MGSAAQKLPIKRLRLPSILGNRCGKEPLLQYSQELWPHIPESDPNSDAGLRVGDDAGRFKEFSFRINLDLDLRVLGQSVGHIQVAPIKAQLAHLRGGAGSRRCVGNLSRSYERIARRSTTLFSHWDISGKRLRRL
jgi:hypothetical protein